MTTPQAEPLRTTLTRTVGIAVVAAAAVAPMVGGFRRFPVLVVLMLWPSFGGHWLEVMFLELLRPRLSENGVVRRVARLAVWFAGGIVFALGARWTAALLLPHAPSAWLPWGLAGGIFIAVELVAHGGLHLRGRPSFYNGLG
jgi:hypothetical protein